MSKNRHCLITFWEKPRVNLPKGVRYAVYGEEICPQSKEIHWQSYVEFDKPCRYAAITKMYNNERIHIEKRRGTRDQARDYCMKDGKYEEFGKWISGQGHRSDLKEITDSMKDGVKLTKIMLENPGTYCRYRSGLKDISAEIIKNNTVKFRKVEVIVLSGKTGVGKTKIAMMEAKYKIQGSQLAWWQDYDGEKIICIDEYNNNIKIDELLAILDGYQLRLAIKGSHTYANWNKVFLTTNLTKDELHENAKDAHRAALFRRIDEFRILVWDEDIGTKC